VKRQASKSGTLEKFAALISAETMLPPSGSEPLVSGPAVRFISMRL